MSVKTNQRSLRHPARLLWVLAIGLATASSEAFSQKPLKEGHDLLTVNAAQATGGVFTEPPAFQRYPNGSTRPNTEVDKQTAGCSVCDTYNTRSWKTWSAVMGNRWTDLGGYRIETSDACFQATMQDSDDVQYSHALRRRGDIGPSGVRRTHDGTVAFIQNRFMQAVREPEGAMSFRDGGVSERIYKANAPYFILGIALHALQDSFSEEHTVRSADWHKVRDYKTYVGTPGATSHAKHKTSPDKFHELIKPTATNGDFVFASDSSSVLKPSAQHAVLASSDLMSAFDSARRTPSQAAQLWVGFASKWLQFDPVPATCSSTTDSCPPDGPPKGDVETLRKKCIATAGREPRLDTDYPRFCWPDKSCR